MLSPARVAGQRQAVPIGWPTTRASQAVVVNGLDFQTVGVATWNTPTDQTPTPIPLALKITNQSDKDCRLVIYGNVQITLKDDAGNELHLNRLGAMPLAALGCRSCYLPAKTGLWTSPRNSVPIRPTKALGNSMVLTILVAGGNSITSKSAATPSP